MLSARNTNKNDKNNSNNSISLYKTQRAYKQTYMCAYARFFQDFLLLLPLLGSFFAHKIFLLNFVFFIFVAIFRFISFVFIYAYLHALSCCMCLLPSFVAVSSLLLFGLLMPALLWLAFSFMWTWRSVSYMILSSFLCILAFNTQAAFVFIFAVICVRVFLAFLLLHVFKYDAMFLSYFSS